jgi:dCTP deaminase
MTVIGCSELVERLRAGTLVISPLLSQKQIGAASIDLRLGNVALMVRARDASHVDPKSVKDVANNANSWYAERDRKQKHERYEVPFDSNFLVHPGSLVLLPTLEWLKLPHDLQGSVTARSTWAREGLSIATATFIEPYYQGIVTLELSNMGQIPISLYPGMRVAQIAFTKVDGNTTRPDSGQFKLSFEPTQGRVAADDEFPFIN